MVLSLARLVLQNKESGRTLHSHCITPSVTSIGIRQTLRPTRIPSVRNASNLHTTIRTGLYESSEQIRCAIHDRLTNGCKPFDKLECECSSESECAVAFSRTTPRRHSIVSVASVRQYYRTRRGINRLSFNLKLKVGGSFPPVIYRCHLSLSLSLRFIFVCEPIIKNRKYVKLMMILSKIAVRLFHPFSEMYI